jgi:hypothetical protein
MTDTTDEFLAHFGIKGMKWGVRNAVGSNGRVSGGGSRKRFDTLADLHAREVAKHPKFDSYADISSKMKAKNSKRQFDTIADLRAHSKAKNRQFDTLADLRDRAKAKNRTFETFSDVRNRKNQKQADTAAKVLSRRANSVKRGEEALSTSHAFNSPSLAIGMKALGIVVGSASLALTVRSLVKNPSAGNLNKVKIGMAAAGAIVSGIQIASVARDARDISNYKKSQQTNTAGR